MRSLLAAIEAECEEQERAARAQQRAARRSRALLRIAREAVEHDLDAPQIRLAPHETRVDAAQSGLRERRTGAAARKRPRGGRPRSESGRNPSGEEVAAWVIAQAQPVRRAAVQAALGGTLNSISASLRRLAKAGRLKTVGSLSQRAYCAPDVSGESSTPDTAASRAHAGRRQPARLREVCAGPEDLHRLIDAHGPVSSEQLRELTGCTLHDLADWGNELVCRAQVDFEGEGKHRVWRLVSEDAVRREVEATIVAQPGILDDRRIALTTSIPQARVALACAELIDERRVQLEPDDTYVPVMR